MYWSRNHIHQDFSTNFSNSLETGWFHVLWTPLFTTTTHQSVSYLWHANLRHKEPTIFYTGRLVTKPRHGPCTCTYLWSSSDNFTEPTQHVLRTQWMWLAWSGSVGIGISCICNALVLLLVEESGEWKSCMREFIDLKVISENFDWYNFSKWTSNTITYLGPCILNLKLQVGQPEIAKGLLHAWAVSPT